MIDNFKLSLNSILDDKKADFIVFFSFDEFFSEIPVAGRDYLYKLLDFQSSNAIFLYSKSRLLYFTDGRYLFEAKNYLCAQNIEVLNITNDNFIDKILGKRVIFLKNNTRFDFYDRHKDKFEFLFIEKEEFLAIFNQSLYFEEKIARNWKIKYPKNFLQQRIQDLLRLLKSDSIYKFQNENRLGINCIFLHDIQFTSWLTGNRSNVSQSCAKENVMFIFFDMNFTLIKTIEIKGNSYQEIMKISGVLENCNIICDRQVSYFYYEILLTICNNLSFHNVNFREFQSIKTNFEIKQMQKAHLSHAKIFNLFEKWVKTVDFTKKNVSEYDIALKLRWFLSQDSKFIDLSFNTIVGADENSAIIHYKPKKETSKILKKDSILLVDCGIQYEFGTTDMTRMILLGNKKELSREFKICYTFVLKAHIKLATTIFPDRTVGKALDFVARREIFKIYQNYNHGTGHGVGFNLNVHEYPSISSLSENPIRENQIISIEPGIYIENKFGIRIENLYVIRKIKDKKIKDKDFLYFESLTFTKINTMAIILNCLDKEEKRWLEKYNKRCKFLLKQ